MNRASAALVRFVEEVAKPANLISAFDARRWDALSISNGLSAGGDSAASGEGSDLASSGGDARMPLSLSAARSGGLDGNVEREEKIRRAREDEEARRRLRAIATDESRIQAAAAREGGADGVTSELGRVDEEVRRERVMLLLQVAARQAVDDLVALQEQKLFLGMMA